MKTQRREDSRLWRNLRRVLYNADSRKGPIRVIEDVSGRFEPMASPDELYDQAMDLRDRGDKPAAIEKLKEAVAIDPKFALGHGLLAKLYVDLAEADAAIAHALKVVELEPKDAFSYTALSVVYQRCGKIPEAEDAKYKAQAIQFGLE